MATVVNISDWLRDNSDQFLPPVCNRMIHDQQLKVFLVGGPNIRMDYHLNEGEEFFHMIKGDMCLKVIEGGKQKDIVIKEGHSFLLPARVPHSPQRYADTVGLVVERERLLSELDGLRFYAAHSSSEILFERWFHCYDLGSQLKPIILQFFNSTEYITARAGPNSQIRCAPYDDDAKARLMMPLNTHVWLRDKLLDRSLSSAFTPLFHGGQASRVGVYGPGRHEIVSPDGETMLWQLATTGPRPRSSSRLRLLSPSGESDDKTLRADDCVILPENTRWSLHNDRGSGVTLSVCMPPPSSPSSPSAP